MWVGVQHEPYLTCPSVCWCVSLHCYACLVQMQSDILQYWIYFVDFYFACVTHFNYFSCFIAITTRVWCYHLLLYRCFIETPNTQWYWEISEVLYSWIQGLDFPWYLCTRMAQKPTIQTRYDIKSHWIQNRRKQWCNRQWIDKMGIHQFLTISLFGAECRHWEQEWFRCISLYKVAR